MHDFNPNPPQHSMTHPETEHETLNSAIHSLSIGHNAVPPTPFISTRSSLNHPHDTNPVSSHTDPPQPHISIPNPEQPPPTLPHNATNSPNQNLAPTQTGSTFSMRSPWVTP